MIKKRKILICSDFVNAKTGFGRVTKCLLDYLYRTNKYEIVHIASQYPKSHPELQCVPWACEGTLPDSPQEMEKLKSNDSMLRYASYGGFCMDEAIKVHRPNCAIFMDDVWGTASIFAERPWFNKINSVIWTTLDSRGVSTLHEDAVRLAPKIKNYWIWSDFATKELHKLGYTQAKTIHGPIDGKNFKRLLNTQRKELRVKFNISENSFIVGYVFRNQLRKSVPNLMEGFAMFKKQNPDSKAKLLLHTSLAEGWPIAKFAKYFNVDLKDVLTTYICSKCREYEVKDISNGLKSNCPFCKTKYSQQTTHPRLGVSEEQLNEIYNLFDTVCSPFTSGGQELILVESKLCDLITILTAHSCGEEYCYPEANSLPLDYSEYWEFQSNFIKASTRPDSICKQLTKVYKMDENKRREMGRAARKWALENYDITYMGPKIEALIDAMPEIDYDFNFNSDERNPDYIVPQIEDDSLFLLEMYHNILKMRHIQENSEDIQGWLIKLKEGMPREEVEKIFKSIATKENKQIKNSQTEFSELLDKNDAGKRLLMVIPEAIGDVFCSTALFRSIKETYPQYHLYVATKPENFDILDGNEYVHKIIPYIGAQMDSLLWSEGYGSHKGWFEVTFLPCIGTQKMFMSHHNGKDVLAFNNKY